MVEVLNILLGLFGTLFFGICAWGLTGAIRMNKYEKERWPPESPIGRAIIVITMIVLCAYLAFECFTKLVL